MRNIGISIAITAVLLFASSVRADTENPKKQLGPHAKSLKVGPGMDARGLSLSGTELVGQDISGAKFDNAILRDCRISDCNLVNVSFRGADLRDSVITDCRIEGANFTDALINGIKGDPMGPPITPSLTLDQLQTTASFKRKDLSDCRIGGYGWTRFDLDLSGFDLRNSRLYGDFSQSRFEGARIRNAILAGIFPSDEIHKTQDVKSRRVMGCKFECRNLLDMSEVTLFDSRISIGRKANNKWNCEGTTFRHCTIYSRAPNVLYVSKNYQHGNFAGNRFEHMDLSDMNFDRMNLTHCSFTDCDLAGATFNDAIISGAGFKTAKGLTADQIKSTWNFKNNRMSDVGLPEGLMKEEGRTEKIK